MTLEHHGRQRLEGHPASRGLRRAVAEHVAPGGGLGEAAPARLITGPTIVNCRRRALP